MLAAVSKSLAAIETAWRSSLRFLKPPAKAACVISRLAMEVIQRLIWRLSQKSAAEPAAATRPIAIDIGVARENKTRIAGRPLGAMNPIIAGRYAELLTAAPAVRPPTTKAVNARWAGSEASNRTDAINPQRDPVAIAPTVNREAQIAAASAG